MSKIKTEILDTTLDLFNKRGISAVSMRTIADKMGISPGNLTYHFKKLEDLLDALYNSFVSETDAKFAGLEAKQIDLALILTVIQSMTETRIKYRFIMQDLLQLMQENKMIRLHYRATLKRRKIQFMELLGKLIEQGIFRKAELANEYGFFYDRVQILGSFWIASAGIDGKKMDGKTTKQNHGMIIQSIYPYLTAKGKKEWVRLVEG